MPDPTPRLEARIRRDFPEPGSASAVLDELRRLDADERVMTGVVLATSGSPGRLHEALASARLDWRDLLVATGLAHADWPQRLDAELGPPSTR